MDWRKEIREKGHTISIVQGISGVCMSGDDGETPWRLARSYATQHKRDEVVLDADKPEERFEEMQTEADQALDKRMVGECRYKLNTITYSSIHGTQHVRSHFYTLPRVAQ